MKGRKRSSPNWKTLRWRNERPSPNQAQIIPGQKVLLARREMRVENGIGQIILPAYSDENKERISVMAKMDYVTSGITKIDFEDSFFVTTELDKFENLEVKEYIESLGGVIKNSVAKTTNYLIYRDGKEETTKYKKALELVQEGTDIKILPLSLFYILRKEKEIIEFGAYPFERNNKSRPIKWMVLKKENNKALLLSAYSIDVKPYNSRVKATVTWEMCTLRKWLNEDFYDIAFSEEEKKRIHLTEVDNSGDPTNQTTNGNFTEDKVFLLSVLEAKTLLSETIQRQMVWTPFARRKYNTLSWISESWWLRSFGHYPDDASYINGYGEVLDHRYIPSALNYGVCPALWIELVSENK